jgi:hypothetical protein
MKTRLSILSILCVTALSAASAKSPVQLSVPSGLKADVSVCGKVTLSWQAASGAASYHLVVMSGGVGSEKDLSSTSMTYDSMKPGVHSFKVKANGVPGSSKDSDYSSDLAFEVKACEVCTPPVVTLTMINPSVIWPPNHKLVPVQLTGTVKTNCPLSASFFRVVDEYGQNQSGPILVPALGGSFAAKILVEADRLGTDKDGRHYGLSVGAANKAGTATSGVLTTVVPHDMGKCR